MSSDAYYSQQQFNILFTTKNEQSQYELFD